MNEQMDERASGILYRVQVNLQRFRVGLHEKGLSCLDTELVPILTDVFDVRVQLGYVAPIDRWDSVRVEGEGRIYAPTLHGSSKFQLSGKLFRKMRKGTTMNQLHRASGIDLTELYRYEKSEVSIIQKKTLDKLTRALGCDADELRYEGGNQ